jgi:hypothetical protein
MNVQHLKVKFFARKRVDLAAAIPVLHGWIQRKALDGVLIDVVDYRHVPDGPGVVLVGHDAMYSLDETAGRLGLLYTRRTSMEGGTLEKLLHAYSAAQAACQLLEREPAFAGKLAFDLRDCEISVNDRMLAPNTESTRQAVEPELRKLFEAVWKGDSYTLEWNRAPPELLRVRAVSWKV